MTVLLRRYIDASSTTFASLNPWIRSLAGIAVSFHAFFWLYNKYIDASEPTLFRVIALGLLLPLLLPYDRTNPSLQNWIRSSTLASVLFAAPVFLFSSLILELTRSPPDPYVVITRQYELLGAIAFFFLIASDRLLATWLMLFVFVLTFFAFQFTATIHLSILISTSSSLLSAYWIFAFALIIAVLRRNQMLADKTSTLNTVGTSIAHELRTPLLSIRAWVRSIQSLSDPSPQQINRTTRAIINEVDSASTLIDMFLVKAQPPEKVPTYEVFDIDEVIIEALNRYPYKSEKARECITTELVEEISLRGPRELFLHVIFNLLKNALEHVDTSNASIKLKTFVDNSLNIIIEDNGKGVQHDHLDHVFTPFFSTSTNYGTGIGLPFCRQTIEENFDGKIEIESNPDNFTRLWIRIPQEKLETSLHAVDN